MLPKSGNIVALEIEIDKDIYKTTTENNTKQSICQDVNCVDNSDVVVLCKKLGIPLLAASELVADYGRDAVAAQLERPTKQKKVKSPGAWQRAALRDKYSDLQPPAETTRGDPACPDCHGAGKVKMLVGDTGMEVTTKCKRCAKERY